MQKGECGMNEIKIFENREFGKVRTVTINNEPWFVGKDVATALGYSNTKDALISHVAEEDRRILKRSEITTIENQFPKDTFPAHFVISDIPNRGLTIINQSGLYALIFGSKLPSAKRFKHWVTSEVLPSIRKHGIYATENVINDILENPDFGIELLSKLKEERAARIKAEKKVGNLENENSLLSQKTLQWADRPMINALIRSYGHALDDNFRLAWSNFKKELLYQHGINLNSRITAYLNKSGSKTRPRTLEMLDESELPKALNTAVALCRESNADISQILEKKAV